MARHSTTHFLMRLCSVSHMGLAKLTMSLFWLNPHGYLPCDKHTVGLFQTGAALSGKAKRLQATSLGWQRLSQAAERTFRKFPRRLRTRMAILKVVTHIYRQSCAVIRQVLDMVCGNGRRALGRVLRKGHRSDRMGWTPDLRRFGSKDEIRQKLLELWPG